MKRFLACLVLTMCCLAIPQQSRASEISILTIGSLGQDNTDCSRFLYRVTVVGTYMWYASAANLERPVTCCGGCLTDLFDGLGHLHCVRMYHFTNPPYGSSCGNNYLSWWYGSNDNGGSCYAYSSEMMESEWPIPYCPPYSECLGVLQLAYDYVNTLHNGGAHFLTGHEDLFVNFVPGVSILSESSTINPPMTNAGGYRTETRVYDLSVPADTTFTVTAEIVYSQSGGTSGPTRSESATSPPSACTAAPIAFGGSPRAKYCGIGSSVNYSSGDLYESLPLFSMKGQGPAVGLTLSYNSLDPVAVPLGPGWTHDLATRLTDLAQASLTLVEEDGRRIVFWESSPGSGSYLPEVQFNRQGVSIQKFADNTFRMTRRDGTTDDFDAQGRLSAKRDRNGNATTLTYAGSDLTQFVDASGRVVSLGYDASHRIVSATDPAGRSWSLGYDAGGHLASIADPQGGVRFFGYDASGRMVSKTNPAGHMTTYAYDESGKLASATDPTGTPALVSYSPATSQATVTGRNGGVTATTYDANLDAPTQVTAPDGGVTSYTYDGYGNVLTMTDASGRTTAYAYDAFGNRTQVTDPLSHVTTYAYNGFGQATQTTDPEGRTTSYAYDAAGNLLSATDPAGAVTQYGYDAQGNVTSVTKPGGGTTTFAYDANGNVATVTDPAGLVTGMSYDVLGNLLSRTDPSGAATSFAYDNLSRLIRVTDSLGNVTAFVYDGNGNRTSATDGNGNTTTFTYTERNRPSTMTDPLGNVTTYAYTFGGCSSCGSGGGLLASVTDADGHTTSYEYDLAGRLTKTIDPLGNETRYGYDALGNRTTQTDANGRVSSFAYDPLSRVLSRTDPLGGIGSFTYYAAGATASVTDPGGNATSYGYDAAGRVSQIASPDTGTTAYTYNTDGTLASKTDARGTTATYSYDAAGRLTRIAYPVPSEDIFFSYDSTGSTFGRGRLTGMSDPSGTTTYHYDALGRLAQETKTVLGVAYTTSYAYDGAGNMSSMTYPSGRVVDYTYNGLNRPASVTGTKGGTATTLASGIAYDNVGNLSVLPLGNGVVQDYAYDWANRLSSVVVHAPWTVAASWAYDNVGNVTQVTDNLTIPPTRSYSYDPLDRLDAASGVFGTFSWSYDANGNRLTQAADNAATTYTYQANRLATVAGGTTRNYSYDAAGNPTGDGTQSYFYDGHGRMVKLFNSGVLSAEYVYDGKGRRVIKKRYTYTIVRKKPVTTITTTVYHYDLLGNLIGETDGAGDFQKDYVYLENHPLAMVAKTWAKESAYWYHNDHLGAPRAMTDVSGGVGWQIEFDPFGNKVIVRVEYVENNLRFPGQYFDAESGLHYNYFRDYDPRTGRYIEPDPVGLEGGMNRYLYTENNPIRYTDPKGLMRFPFLPPNGCEYYKKKCEENTCGSEKDDYACKAYSCCKTFGDNPTGNCIRGCLIEFDKRNCARLSGEERNRCRRLAHWDCYDRCLGHAMGGEGLLFGPPKECIDAMNAVGGMGF